MSRVFRVYNGLTGFSAVHRIVLADTADEACKRLRAAFPAFERRARSLEAEEVALIDGVEVEDHD